MALSTLKHCYARTGYPFSAVRRADEGQEATPPFRSVAAISNDDVRGDLAAAAEEHPTAARAKRLDPGTSCRSLWDAVSDVSADRVREIQRHSGYNRPTVRRVRCRR